MPVNKKTKVKKEASLVKNHLGRINRALLEGEKRPAFLEFLRKTNDRRGIYALYDSKNRLYYTGKASDLPKRLDQHLKDKHSVRWETMTLFFLSDSADVAELEGLIVAAANPPGNTQKPRIGADKRKELKRFLKQDAMTQIDRVIYPNNQEKKDELSGRITPKKLKSISQARLANSLGISQGRVSQLINEEPKNYSTLRKYIQEAGRRDSVLLLLQKAKVD